MSASAGADRIADQHAAANLPLRDEYVCWSRMQTEAGQPLESIIDRKERERRLGYGLFFWGVGNAPPAITKSLARAGVPVRAVFSVMKSKPKAIDVAPTRTVVWRRYVDVSGADRPVPPHVLVTSRGDSATGPKRVHYALTCRSDAPLAPRRDLRFDPAAFRNAGGNGAPVGASQVTALLRRVETDHEGGGYEENLTAWLTGSYWVRLADPIELSLAKRALLGELANLDDEAWLTAVSELQSGPPSPTHFGDVGPLI